MGRTRMYGRPQFPFCKAQWLCVQKCQSAWIVCNHSNSWRRQRRKQDNRGLLSPDHCMGKWAKGRKKDCGDFPVPRTLQCEFQELFFSILLSCFVIMLVGLVLILVLHFLQKAYSKILKLKHLDGGHKIRRSEKPSLKHLITERIYA